MAEMERMRAEEGSFKAIAALQATAKSALEKAFISVKEVEMEYTEDKDRI
jgi:hypothetical protein